MNVFEKERFLFRFFGSVVGFFCCCFFFGTAEGVSPMQALSFWCLRVITASKQMNKIHRSIFEIF